MRIALLLGKMSLGPRTDYPFATFRRTEGMTGTDVGFVRIGECLRLLGHDVEFIVPSTQEEHAGSPVRSEPSGKYDAAIAINEPDLLRGVDATVRACSYWLNDMSFNRAGFNRYAGLFFSPSQAHLEMVRDTPGWKRVEVSQQNPVGVELYRFEPEKWSAVELGRDPERYAGVEKIPGKVVYCSSPDRGLHWLLQEWPRIHRAAPHSTLHVYYRLGKWIQDLGSVPYPFPPIEALRARALYINEALGRLQNHGITVHDSVPRETIEQEMASAECLAYPCDTVRWSEGFSCTLLEGCAARACPVTLETDAFPQVYGSVVPMVQRDRISEWGDLVIRALTDDVWRSEVNARCSAFAAERTWRATAEKMVERIEQMLSGDPKAWKLVAAQ